MSTVLDQGQLPSPFRSFDSTLRLAPSVGRCYELPAANTPLSALELHGLATHWGKTIMGPKHDQWTWQALQIDLGEPILLCASNIDIQYRKAFKRVIPELLHLMASLEKNGSAWIICHDKFIVQSGLVLHGKMKSVRTWPSQYSHNFEDVIHRHRQLSERARDVCIELIIESIHGEVHCNAAP